MGEISDIEELLRKAKRHATLIAWIKVGIVSLCTLIGSAFGAGMTASKYLDQLMTKDQGQKLLLGQQTQLESMGSTIRLVTDRVAATEQNDRFQDKREDDLRTDLRELQSRSGTLVRARGNRPND